MDDYEIKEAVKILKEKGKKLAVEMNLIKENEENKEAIELEEIKELDMKENEEKEKKKETIVIECENIMKENELLWKERRGKESLKQKERERVSWK